MYPSGTCPCLSFFFCSWPFQDYCFIRRRENFLDDRLERGRTDCSQARDDNINCSV
jgi:hypothetical protein